MGTLRKLGHGRGGGDIMIFFAMLVLILFLALLPNVGGTMLNWLPMAMHRWVASHDDINNILAFGIFGFWSFMLRFSVPDRAGLGWLRRPARLLAKVTHRVCLLLALVCVLEVVQRWIPGRVSGLRDVSTGWSGVFAAWLVVSVIDRGGKKGGDGGGKRSEEAG